MPPVLRRARPQPIDCNEGYDLWAPSYDAEAEQPLPRIEMRALRALLPEVRGLRAADLACGTGRHARMLERAGARVVVAVDRSLAMLEQLRQRSPHPAVCADLRSLPHPAGCIDVAVSGLALGHLDDPGPAIVEVARLLRRGGFFLLSDFHEAAANAGLLRTFQSGRRTYVLPHHPRSREAYASLLAVAGLELLQVREATARDEPAAFGPGKLPLAQRDLPLVLVMAARKP